MKLQDIVTKPGQEAVPASADVNKVVNIDANAVVDPNAQVQEPVEQVDDNTQQTNSDDLLTKVTRFVDNKTPENKSEDDIDNDVFNDAEFRKKIDALEDPELKQYMLSMRKTGVRGIQNSLQEISVMRKELTALKDGMNPGWTKERVQELLNDKDFLTAAQPLLGNINEQSVIGDDDFVPDSVKQTLLALQNENAQFKQQFNTLNQNQNQANLQREHTTLSEKYGNYDSDKIDNIRQSLLNGKIQANSEHLYKAFYHDENVKKAYQMGLQDRNSGVEEKQQISSISTNNVQQPNTLMQPEKSESNKQFLNRIIANSLARLKK